MNSRVNGRRKIGDRTFRWYFEEKFCCKMKERNRAALEGKVGSKTGLFLIQEK